MYYKEEQVRQIPAMLAAALLVLAAGCVRYHERLVLNPEGTGVLDMSFAVDAVWMETEPDGPGLFDENQVRTALGAVPGVIVRSVAETREGGQYLIRIVLTFDSADRLTAIGEAVATVDPGIDFVGHVDIERLADQTIRFTRTIDIADSTTTAEDRATVQEVRWYYTVKFPGRIIESNADIVSREGNAATWEYSLSTLAERPVTLSAEVSVRHESWLVRILVIGAVFGAVFFVLYTLLNRLERTQRPPKQETTA